MVRVEAAIVLSLRFIEGDHNARLGREDKLAMGRIS
jgi:hypothetical protein